MSASATSGFGSPGDHGPPGADPGTTPHRRQDAMNLKQAIAAYNAAAAAAMEEMLRNGRWDKTAPAARAEAEAARTLRRLSR